MLTGWRRGKAFAALSALLAFPTISALPALAALLQMDTVNMEFDFSSMFTVSICTAVHVLVEVLISSNRCKFRNSKNLRLKNMKTLHVSTRHLLLVLVPRFYRAGQQVVGVKFVTTPFELTSVFVFVFVPLPGAAGVSCVQQRALG